MHKKVSEIPDRVEKQKLAKDWVIQGPFVDSEDHSFYFRLNAPKLRLSCIESIPESDAMFDERAVEIAISKLVARAMEVELSDGFAKRLSGKKDDLTDKTDDSIIVVDDFSQGMGNVRRRRLSHDRTGDVPGKRGGLILPA
jgi:hypothetical protein